MNPTSVQRAHVETPKSQPVNGWVSFGTIGFIAYLDYVTRETKGSISLIQPPLSHKWEEVLNTQ